MVFWSTMLLFKFRKWVIPERLWSNLNTDLLIFMQGKRLVVATTEPPRIRDGHQVTKVISFESKFSENLDVLMNFTSEFNNVVFIRKKRKFILSTQC